MTHFLVVGIDEKHFDTAPDGRVLVFTSHPVAVGYGVARYGDFLVVGMTPAGWEKFRTENQYLIVEGVKT